MKSPHLSQPLLCLPSLSAKPSPFFSAQALTLPSALLAPASPGPLPLQGCCCGQLKAEGGWGWLGSRLGRAAQAEVAGERAPPPHLSTTG